MTSPASRSTAVFRACVVNAVRESEALMEQLVRITRSELSEAEQKASGIQERLHIGDALRAIDQQEPTLLKSYPMALLEVFSDGGGAVGKSRAALDTGMDFGELTLVDDSAVMAQVELARAQQIAGHATDAALAELNTLVSSAQGFSNVQPERNPFRPENYIRALQRAVDDCQVSSETRQLWMERMRVVMGPELTAAYKRVTASLREHGVKPVGYIVASGHGAPRGAGGAHIAGASHGHAPVHSASGMPGPGGWSHTNMGYAPPQQQQQAAAYADPQEAVLAAGILRQMLAAGGDPFAYDAVPTAAPAPRMTAVSQAIMMPPANPGTGLSGAQAADAMEDIAQLERLVGRLSGSLGAAQSGLPLYGVMQPMQGVVSLPTPQWQDAVSVPGNLSAYGSLSPRTAAEVLSRMMDHIAQDSRLLAPVQRAVQNLEPALKQLVRHDPSFFSNEQHPARRLLDNLTQRSLDFKDPESKGFRKYIQIVNAAVQHLATVPVHDASAFEHVSGALESAWNTQTQQLRRQQDDEQKQLAATERRELLTARLAQDFRKLPEAQGASPGIVEFVIGVWAGVVARAQLEEAARHGGDPGGDPQGFLSVVPQILWCAQPDHTPEDARHMLPLLTGMQFTVREGLRSVGQTDQEVAWMMQRIAEWQEQVAKSAAEPEPVLGNLPVQAPSTTPEVIQEVPAEPAIIAVDDVASPRDSGTGSVLQIGQWIELINPQRTVKTQLTWVSPHNTLFLFTALDASTQSMTRRMLDKLTAEGMIRLLEDQRVVARALGAVAADAKDSKLRNSKKVA
ncbi:DUF1631 family protein [Diaphorobacter aerolatus]|uniref:DUF1631 family protein n=1 Tax=Diaphorobacter aerolatus TaxID=1288495 RepID=A0A7H0GJJ2_9BURK|nr:DUF1631 family protein [Diaphorobacter aerolatus]QNP48458.1 DUF1631 family protein [Diaphorobacter aerolatus]